MELARARYLISPGAAAALEEFAGLNALGDPVRAATELRRHLPGDEAAAIAEQLSLRAKARERFGSDRGWLYSAAGLEMMTHPDVAAWRAAWLHVAGKPVVDLTVGLGGDAVALAEAGATVAGLELDPAVALLAAHNLPGVDVVRGHAEQPPFDITGSVVVLDPPRRAEGRRQRAGIGLTVASAEALARTARAGVVKAAPSTRTEHLGGPAELAYVQLGRSMRECTIRVGEGARLGQRTAVHLPTGATLASDSPAAADIWPRPGAVIYDPEPCVTLAALVQQLAHELGAARLDERVGYLTGDEVVDHPLARAFEVLAVVPFSIKGLRTELRRAGWRPVEIRRRAFPVEPDELRRLLGRFEGDPVTIIATTVGGSRLAIVARRIEADDGRESGLR